jgi:hypothetical protein
MVTRFADVILIREDGSVSVLDVGAGTLDKIATDKEDFCRKVDEGDNAGNWFLLTLVDRCVSAGLAVGPGQCYGFKVSPVLGGLYTVDNTYVADLVVNLCFLSHIHQQIKELPDGTKIKLVVQP